MNWADLQPLLEDRQNDRVTVVVKSDGRLLRGWDSKVSCTL